MVVVIAKPGCLGIRKLPGVVRGFQVRQGQQIGSADVGRLLRPNDARRRQQPGSSSNRGSEDIRRAEGLRVQGLGFRV